MFRLAGYQLLMERGNFVKGKHRRNLLQGSLERYLSKHVIGSYPAVYLERRLFNNWEEVSIHQMDKHEAMNMYHKLAKKDLVMYGAELFNITAFESNKLTPKVLVVVNDGFFLSKTSKMKLSFFQIDQNVKELTDFDFVPYESLVKVLRPAENQVVIESKTKAQTVEKFTFLLSRNGN